MPQLKLCIKLFKTLAKILLDLVFPPICVGCHIIGTRLCEKCYAGVEFLQLPIKIDPQLQYLDRILAAAHYGPPISSLIKAIKFQSAQEYCQVAALLIYISATIPRCDAITAVPLHPQREQERGFNQAEEIAKHLSPKLKLPYLPLLIRTQNTTPQSSVKDKSARLIRFKNAFEIHPKYVDRFTVPARCLLIDDVCTTGATLNACAKILKQAGCKKVIALTLAHGS